MFWLYTLVYDWGISSVGEPSAKINRAASALANCAKMNQVKTTNAKWLSEVKWGISSVGEPSAKINRAASALANCAKMNQVKTTYAKWLSEVKWGISSVG